MAKDRFRANNLRDKLKKIAREEARANKRDRINWRYEKSYANYKNNMRVIKSNFSKLKTQEVLTVQNSLKNEMWKCLYHKIKGIAKRVGGIYYPCILVFLSSGSTLWGAEYV